MNVILYQSAMMQRRDSLLDRSAIGLSGLCVVHCLGTSLLLTGLTAAGGIWSHNVHAIGLAVALPIAALALIRGVMAHRQGWPIALGIIGLATMAGSLLLPHGSTEIAVSLTGVLLLGTAHLLNLRWLRR